MHYIYVLLTLVPAFHINDEVIVFLPSYNECTGIVQAAIDTKSGYIYNVRIQECPNKLTVPVTLKYVEEKYLDFAP